LEAELAPESNYGIYHVDNMPKRSMEKRVLASQWAISVYLAHQKHVDFFGTSAGFSICVGVRVQRYLVSCKRERERLSQASRNNLGDDRSNSNRAESEP
jgi:hypothetical protein